MEAILRPISWSDFPEQARGMFQAFRTPEVGWDLVANKNAFVERVLPGSVVRKLTEAEMNRYREPYPDASSRTPVWRWPNEIPIDGEPKDVAEAVTTYHEWLKRSDVPKLLFYAQPGALVPAGAVDWCRRNLKNLKARDVGPGIHYLQEDNPHLIGEELARWCGGS
jgi:haloalkane dehalogenase